MLHARFFPITDQLAFYQSCYQTLDTLVVAGQCRQPQRYYAEYGKLCRSWFRRPGDHTYLWRGWFREPVCRLFIATVDGPAHPYIERSQTPGYAHRYGHRQWLAF